MSDTQASTEAYGDPDRVLSPEFAAQCRRAFRESYPEHWLIGALKSGTDDLAGRVWGEQALERAHAIIRLYEERKA